MKISEEQWVTITINCDFEDDVHGIAMMLTFHLCNQGSSDGLVFILIKSKQS